MHFRVKVKTTDIEFLEDRLYSKWVDFRAWIAQGVVLPYKGNSKHRMSAETLHTIFSVEKMIMSLRWEITVPLYQLQGADLHLRAVHMDSDAAVAQGLETGNVVSMPVDRIPLVGMDIYPAPEDAPMVYPFYPILIAPKRVTRAQYDKFVKLFMLKILPEMVTFDVKAPTEVRIQNMTPQRSSTNSARYREHQLKNQNNRLSRTQVRPG